MRCFVNVKEKREFEIFFYYCVKNDIRFCSGERVISHFHEEWLDTGVSFFFDNDKFDYLSYGSIGYGERHKYKKISFKDIFIENKQLDIE